MVCELDTRHRLIRVHTFLVTSPRCSCNSVEVNWLKASTQLSPLMRPLPEIVGRRESSLLIWDRLVRAPGTRAGLDWAVILHCCISAPPRLVERMSV